MWFQLKFRRSGIASLVIHSWRAQGLLAACEVEQEEGTLLNHIHADRNIPRWGKGSLDNAGMIHFALQRGKRTSLPKVLVLSWGCDLCEQCHGLLPDHFCRSNYDAVRLCSFLPLLPSVPWHCSALSYCPCSKAEEKKAQRHLSFLKDQCQVVLYHFNKTLSLFILYVCSW